LEVPALALDDVTRSLGRYHAVEHASFQIHQREIVGLAGHESSGAAELVRMALGLLRPTEGTVKVYGEDIYAADPAGLKRVGSVLNPPAFFETWTGRQNLEYAADMSGMRDAQRLNWAISRSGLSGRVDDYVRSYTPSFRQRLAIARALVAKPDLLVLEEPFEHLDAETVNHLIALFIKLMREADIAVLVVSRRLPEMTRWVRRTIIMDGGRILHDGPTTQIQAAGREVVLALNDAEKAAEDLVRVRGMSAELTSAETLRVGGHVDISEIVGFLTQRRYKVTGIARHDMTLDDVLVRLSAGPLPPPPSVAPNPEDVKDPLELLDDGDADLSAFLKTSGPDDEGGQP
jgi:ABC-2 type transport system ATP-binding protein